MSALAVMKRVVFTLAFGAVGVGIWAVTYWGYRHGISGGRFGGLSRDGSPALFWFFLIMNAIYGGVFVAQAAVSLAPSLRRYTRPLWIGVVLSVLVIGAVAAVALVHMFVKSALSESDPVQRWLELGGGLLVVGVFVSLLVFLWGGELKDTILRKRSQSGDRDDE